MNNLINNEMDNSTFNFGWGMDHLINNEMDKPTIQMRQYGLIIFIFLGFNTL